MAAALVQSILNRYLQKYLKNVKTGEESRILPLTWLSRISVPLIRFRPEKEYHHALVTPSTSSVVAGIDAMKLPGEAGRFSYIFRMLCNSIDWVVELMMCHCLAERI